MKYLCRQAVHLYLVFCNIMPLKPLADLLLTESNFVVANRVLMLLFCLLSKLKIFGKKQFSLGLRG